MDNPLKNFFDLKKFNFLNKDKSVVAIDFGSSSVKVVQIKKEKGKLILESYAELATGRYSGLSVGQVSVLPPEKMVELLTDLFKEANITAKQACISIPLRSSMLLTLEIPNLGRTEIDKMVPIEARKYIPVPVSEVYLDWWLIPSGLPGDFEDESKPKQQGPEMIEVLVVAVHKDTIQQYKDICAKLGLTVRVFEVETFSALRAAVTSDLKPKAMIDLGASTTKLAIMDYGVVRSSHTINKGAQDITIDISKSLGLPFAKAEEVKRKVGLIERVEEESLKGVISPILDYIFSEVNRVLVDYQKKHARTVDKVVLIGSGSLLRGILDEARGAIDVPILIGRPFDKVSVPVFLEEVLAEEGPGFSTAVGLAVRGAQDL